MKSLRFYVVLALAAIVVPAAFGQTFNSATTGATATARIIAPITLTLVTNLNFGDVVASGVVGSVTVTPGGVRTNAGGTTLGNGAAVTAASFTVGGQANATYTITLPASATVTSGANNMTINGFSSTPTPTGTIDGTPLAVGATLQVGINQPQGTYTGPFNVTVAYN